MSGEIRWVALLPDPVTGLDQPIKAISGQDMVWIAPDQKAATKQVKAALSLAAYTLCAVVSVVDWEARKQIKQRPKLIHEPYTHRGFTMRNASQACLTCGVPVNPSALYCAAHRSWKARKRYTRSA